MLLLMATVSEAWSRLDRWLARHAPASAALLAPPADPREITSAEAALGLTFPPQIIESLRRHNGVVNEAGLLPGKPLLSVADIVDQRGENISIAEDLDEDEVDDDEDPWWHRLWLPFASSDGDSQFVDLRPESFENIGWHWHDSGAEHGGWFDLEDYLSNTADVLENGGDVSCPGWAVRRPYLLGDDNPTLLWATEQSADTDWGAPLRPAPTG
jgi:cell wall assembly regulator SMI1